MQTVKEWDAREFIKAKKITQGKMAEMLGVFEASLSRQINRGGLMVIERPDGTLSHYTDKRGL